MPGQNSIGSAEHIADWIERTEENICRRERQIPPWLLLRGIAVVAIALAGAAFLALFGIWQATDRTLDGMIVAASALMIAAIVLLRWRRIKIRIEP